MSNVALAAVVIVMALIQILTMQIYLSLLPRPRDAAAAETTDARVRRLHREFNLALNDARAEGWDAWVRGMKGHAMLYLTRPEPETDHDNETQGAHVQAHVVDQGEGDEEGITDALAPSAAYG